jgi:hypothetical protein
MTARVGSGPVVRQKARMPPSTIPQAQVQQIIAELRASEAHSDVPREYADPAPGGRRRAVIIAVTFLAVGALLGGAVNLLRPGAGLFDHKAEAETKPTALSMTTPVPIKPSARPAAPPAAVPAAAPLPVAQPAAKALAETQPTLRPPVALDKVSTVPIRPCLSGGPCRTSDVQAAEQRLENAYRAAQRAGASPGRLASVRQRWNGLKAGAAEKPRSTVAGYRKLASELHARPAPKRRAPARSEPLPFRRSR